MSHALDCSLARVSGPCHLSPPRLQALALPQGIPISPSTLPLPAWAQHPPSPVLIHISSPREGRGHGLWVQGPILPKTLKAGPRREGAPSSPPSDELQSGLSTPSQGPRATDSPRTPHWVTLDCLDSRHLWLLTEQRAAWNRTLSWLPEGVGASKGGQPQAVCPGLSVPGAALC